MEGQGCRDPSGKGGVRARRKRSTKREAMLSPHCRRLRSVLSAGSCLSVGAASSSPASIPRRQTPVSPSKRSRHSVRAKYRGLASDRMRRARFAKEGGSLRCNARGDMGKIQEGAVDMYIRSGCARDMETAAVLTRLLQRLAGPGNAGRASRCERTGKPLPEGLRKRERADLPRADRSSCCRWQPSWCDCIQGYWGFR